MDRQERIEELADFTHVAAGETRQRMIRDILRRLPDPAMIDVYREYIGEDSDTQNSNGL